MINTGTTDWGLENVLRSNPVSMISKPRAPRPRDRRLEAGELEKLLSAGASPNLYFRPVVLFAIETGMRKGEILSLTWENVHLGKRYVRLPDTKNGDSRDVSLSPQPSLAPVSDTLNIEEGPVEASTVTLSTAINASAARAHSR